MWGLRQYGRGGRRGQGRTGFGVGELGRAAHDQFASGHLHLERGVEGGEGADQPAFGVEGAGVQA